MSYFLLLLIFLSSAISGNEDAKRLFDDLMMTYNKYRRPASTYHEAVNVQLRLRLSQIIDVHELDQIMYCSVWLRQSWVDKKLSWKPEQYGGVDVIYVPYEMIWVPDIVLINNADSHYNITIATKATLHSNGKVIWEPPAFFKSLCQIDIRWFPFDDQKCVLKFGSWSYPEDLLHLTLLDAANEHSEKMVNEYGEAEEVFVIDGGIDLSDYYPSVEWDIMSTIAQRRNRKFIPKNAGIYEQLDFELVLRRKPLFYTVNLVFPCVGISFLTIMVFYLPSDSGEKVSLCINILVALTMFFLLLIDIMPANSVSMPFVGQFLLFTMILVTCSVLITVVSLQFHFRKPTTHTMSDTIRMIFLDILPRILFMRQPTGNRQLKTVGHRGPKKGLLHKDKGRRLISNYKDVSESGKRLGIQNHKVSSGNPNIASLDPRLHKIYNSPKMIKSFENLCFIAELLKKKDQDNKVDQDWKFVAMVLDRLFLIIFSMVCFFGTGWILMQAPYFYDKREPIENNISSTSKAIQEGGEDSELSPLRSPPNHAGQKSSTGDSNCPNSSVL